MVRVPWKLFQRRPANESQSEIDSRLAELTRAADIDGLIQLLKKTEPQHKPRVEAVLKELTGRDFGSKAKLWRRWRESVQDSDSSDASAKTVRVVGFVKWLCVTVVLGALVHLRHWKWWQRS